MDLDAFPRLLADLVDRLDQLSDLDEAAAETVDFAVRLVGSDQAGIVLRGAGRSPQRLAASDPVLAQLDAADQGPDLGPDLEGLFPGESLTIADTRSDQRWPGWSSMAAELGLLSAHLVGMPPLRGRPMTLELFCARPRTFTAQHVARSAQLAAQAGRQLRSVDRVANLTRAIQTRALIGQAQGILMERFDLTGVQAMSFLRRSSQDSHIRIRDLATQIVSARDTALLLVRSEARGPDAPPAGADPDADRTVRTDEPGRWPRPRDP